MFSGSWQQTVQGNGLWERGHKKKRSAVTPLIACRVFPGLIVGNGNPGKSSRSPWVWEMEMGAFEGPGSWSWEKYPEQELQRSAHQPPLKRVQKLAEAREWTTRKGAGADITRAHTGLDSSCSCPLAGSPAAHRLGPGLNRLSVSSQAELTLHKAPLVPLHKVKRGLKKMLEFPGNLPGSQHKVHWKTTQHPTRKNSRHLASNQKLSDIKEAGQYDAQWIEKSTYQKRPLSNKDNGIRTKYIKIVIMTVTYMLKTVEKNISTVRRVMEDTRLNF